MCISFFFEHASSAISIIESCIKDVFSWLVANKLSVNPKKTEYLLFNSRNINSQVININFNSLSLNLVSVQLRNFCHIRSLISKTAAITLANSFIHSCLDFCNSLFYGLSNYSNHRLQKVQNTAAHILTRSVHSHNLNF